MRKLILVWVSILLFFFPLFREKTEKKIVYYFSTALTYIEEEILLQNKNYGNNPISEPIPQLKTEIIMVKNDGEEISDAQEGVVLGLEEQKENVSVTFHHSDPGERDRSSKKHPAPLNIAGALIPLGEAESQNKPHDQ